MHEKAYSIDGAILRSGSANFSCLGSTEQANDLIVIRDERPAAAFERQFETIWNGAKR
jgi:hypothetical protein